MKLCKYLLPGAEQDGPIQWSKIKKKTKQNESSINKVKVIRTVYV